jgi:aspartyl protease family protein
VSRLLIGFALLAALGALSSTASAAQKLKLFALFQDKAIIKIDGTKRLLAAGETSPEGVKLIATDTHKELAEVEISGQRTTLRLGVISSAGFGQAKASDSITLWADRGGFFFSDGSINGAAVKFLIDTGANTIALNSRTAERIGLDYKRLGRRGLASTAGGMVAIYGLTLDSVSVGGITLYNVDAGVIEGDHPVDVLLGMSFLGRLNMTRDGDKLELTTRY